MQRKAAEKLIEETRGLVGAVVELHVLDRATDSLQRRRYRVLANDHVLNLKDPDASRVCLDVYARAADVDSNEVIYVSLDKLWKQRGPRPSRRPTGDGEQSG